MHYTRVAHTLRALVILCALVTVAHADVDDFLVNDDGGVAVQTNPRIAVSADGGFVIAWADRRSGSNDIYTQRYDPSANPIGINQKANDDVIAAWQAEPSIACDFAGRYWLTWKDYRNGSYPFGPDIFFQRFDTALTRLGGNRDLTLELPDSLKETPDIAVSPTGAVVVVWAGYRNGNWDIYGQLIAADGTLRGGNFRVNSDAGTAQQHAPRVAYSEDGWFVVTWYDNRLGDDDIFVRRYDSLGVPLSGNVKVNSDTGDDRQAFPDIATDAAGRFTVVWVDWRNGRYPTNPDIYSRTFDTLMVAASIDARMNSDVSVRAQREPTIASDRLGNVAVIWSDSVGASFDIVGQMIDADGVVREANFEANSFLDSAQFQADVALDGRFRYLTWVDKRNGNYDIYAAVQQYNDPTLTASPLYLDFSMDEGGPLPAAKSVVLNHAGYNPLNYEIQSSQGWLDITPSTGTTPETINVSVNDGGLTAGTYLATLTLIDTDNDDSTLSIPITLTVEGVLTASPWDTLTIGSIAVGKSSIGSVLLEGRLSSSLSDIYLPMRYDTSVLTIDSAVIDGSLPSGYDLAFGVDTLAGEVLLSITDNTASSPIGSGFVALAEVFFTTKDIDCRMPLDTARNDTLCTKVVDTSGADLAPIVIPGEIIVGTPTAIGDNQDFQAPDEVALLQNYPNPFNAETIIRFELSRAVSTRLTIHNVLGQEVAVLVDHYLPAGLHEYRWDGLSRSGRVAASGVYFYRLQTESLQRVRKMLLLK
ncbi:T9SS type A sorting domain-containing protein [bacterium]|nr:T9SS type A sorting domain-containing protein [bacterium]MCB2201626.1 T9SS type A sorting domain-containing protein [bacterium]